MLAATWWSDRPLAAALIAATLANLALYAYVWRALAGLPEMMPLHYDAQGVVDQLGRPSELFRLPIIGSIVLVADAALAALMHRRERPAAHVLIWVGLGVQVVLASGAWLVITRAVAP